MANCAQCSAELIGSAKFCATCGAPAAAAPASDEGPSTLSGLAAATPGALSGASGPSHGPASHVNPFAATASPTSHAAGGAPNEPGKRASEPRQPATGEAPDGAAPRSPSKPPPGADGSHVSPLAVSNALSQRGAFQEALASAEEKVRSSVAPPAAPRAKKPGTQLMQGAPSRPVAPAGEDPAPAPAAAKKAPPRTVAMSFNVGQPGAFQPPGVGAPGAPPSVAQSGGGPLQAPSLAQPSLAQPSLAQPSAAQPSAAQPGAAQPPSAIAPGSAPHLAAPSAVHPGGAPSAVQPGAVQPSAVQPSAVHPGAAQPGAVQPPSVAQPGAVQPPGAIHAPAIGQPAAPQGAAYNAAYPQPAAPYAQGPQPAAPGGWGWSGAAAPPAGYPYPFSYTPGSRVQVTWSNGQRYPATVSQVSGSQCLVVFPDGQQHWVEMQYLSPS